MQFRKSINGHDFFATEESFSKNLEKMKLLYQYRNKELPYLALVLLDNDEARKYIVSKISEFIPNVYSFDFGNSNIQIRDINEYLKSQPVALYNLENYFLRLSEEREIDIYEAKKLVFNGINMVRDSLFLEYITKFIMFLDEEDYIDFMTIADDFFSYCQIRVDLNECFIDENSLSLSEYYNNERIKKLTLNK